MRKKYEKLYNQYPTSISLNQLYKICNISKRSAAYLLNNGIIPCEQNDNKTWRYRIKLSDVITYLRRREQLGSKIPQGAMNSKRADNPRYSFSALVKENDGNYVEQYFVRVSKDYPDIVTTAQVSKLFGLCEKTIRRIIQSGDIEPIVRQPKLLIPLARVIQFAGTQRFINLHSNSPEFVSVLGGYKEWRNAK